eukprot:2504405-Pleurochrysis_carterae.AAC.2
MASSAPCAAGSEKDASGGPASSTRKYFFACTRYGGGGRTEGCLGVCEFMSQRRLGLRDERSTQHFRTRDASSASLSESTPLYFQ